MSSHPTICPHCQSNLEGNDILEEFQNKYPDDPKKALISAKLYGWSTDHPVKFCRAISVYNRDKDMTVAWVCPDCDKSFST